MSASSAQVPVWVPIVVAVFGFAGLITAQLIAARREDRRWRRELDREERRWQRERERDREDRSYEGRAAGYAEFIGAVEAFDFVLFRSRHVAGSGPLDERSADELRTATAQARNALGPVNLHAPERIRAMLRDAMIPRSRLAERLLSDRGEAECRPLWDEGQRAYRLVRAEMRRDLGLDAEDLRQKA